jgi:protein tyrosine phosphatase
VTFSHEEGFHQNSEKAYIATQAPLRESIPRFWEMVWLSHSRVIVMLTNLIENSMIKADQYWPSGPGKFRTYGAFHVSSSYALVVLTSLQVVLLEETKETKKHGGNFLGFKF